jgi:hypothetical protein
MRWAVGILLLITLSCGSTPTSWNRDKLSESLLVQGVYVQPLRNSDQSFTTTVVSGRAVNAGSETIPVPFVVTVALVTEEDQAFWGRQWQILEGNLKPGEGRDFRIEVTGALISDDVQPSYTFTSLSEL